MEFVLKHCARRGFYGEINIGRSSMQKIRIACFTSLFLIGGLGVASAGETSGQTGAQQPAAPSGTSRAGTAGEMQKGDAMKGGEMGGGSGNTGVPGTSPAAEGNRNQDSRTTKTRDR
ncbi:hypothetical protein [Methylorubrum aminovorans]|nr:hypothetical protein [Methylorubrum aminovorans]GMA74232.1 hypothetical protein GCM10025880_06490 [Methylorubrum aminovorans]